MVSKVDLAWLAGLLDGEGSVGVQRNGEGLACAVQLSMTCAPTVERAADILRRLGVRALFYRYAERNPEKHKPFHYLRIGRVADCLVLATAIESYSTTKKGQWLLLREFAAGRMEGRTVTASGKLAGGPNGKGYKHLSPEDWSIYERLRDLNRRGPERGIARIGSD